MEARPRARVYSLAAFTLLAALWLGWGQDAVARWSMRATQRSVWDAGVYDETTFHRLEVRPDDFLAILPFGGEAFADFAALHARASFRPRRVELLALAPLTSIEEDALAITQRLLEALLGQPVVRVAPSIALAHQGGTAWDGVALAEDLAVRDVLRIAVVSETLTVTDFPWVFGYTDVDGGVAILSLRELPTDAARLAFQLGSLALHEVGHALGLEHCVFYDCVMVPASSLARTVELGARFCPVCLRKIAHVLGRDARSLLIALESALRAGGLLSDADLTRAEVDQLDGRGAVAPWR